MTKDPATPHPDDHALDGWEEVLADVEKAVRSAFPQPGSHTKLAASFWRGYAMRDAVLRRDAIEASFLPPGAIWTIIAERAQRLSKGGEPMAALGYILVSIVTELDASPVNHPRRQRLDALRRRAAAVLNQVGPQVADKRAKTFKGADATITRH